MRFSAVHRSSPSTIPLGSLPEPTGLVVAAYNAWARLARVSAFARVSPPLHPRTCPISWPLSLSNHEGDIEQFKGTSDDQIVRIVTRAATTKARNMDFGPYRWHWRLEESSSVPPRSSPDSPHRPSGLSNPGKPSDAGQIGGNGYEETCSIPEIMDKGYLELPECSFFVVGAAFAPGFHRRRCANIDGDKLGRGASARTGDM
ncbi:hypothetical protein V493_02828 [Pseudogymnoascus sp. VKM F-4281 (FW-2241)]|nr:hypothetical protein V493_02828 [Pseudogymnoascus sp. VKM F-4281 (FW-2241)]